MHRLSAALFDCGHHFINHDIGLVRRGRANMDRLIRHLNVQGLRIRVRIDGDRSQAHLAGSLDDVAGNLAPVGDQDFLEHEVSSWVFG